jgi:hypothetical protein
VGRFVVEDNAGTIYRSYDSRYVQDYSVNANKMQASVFDWGDVIWLKAGNKREASGGPERIRTADLFRDRETC